jgi:hypothetical protein
MAYRVRQVATIKYGQFGEYLKTVKKLAAVSEARGWSPIRVLVPTAGPNNGVFLETEYADLATFEAENQAFYDDEEAFDAFRSGAAFVVEGTAYTEILEDMPMDFPGSD